MKVGRGVKVQRVTAGSGGNTRPLALRHLVKLRDRGGPRRGSLEGRLAHPEAFCSAEWRGLSVRAVHAMLFSTVTQVRPETLFS